MKYEKRDAFGANATSELRIFIPHPSGAFGAELVKNRRCALRGGEPVNVLDRPGNP